MLVMTKGEKKKRKIFEIAINLFKEKGYDNISIEEIAANANIAKGTFYIYFPSKANLIAKLFTDYDYIYIDLYNTLGDVKSSYDKTMAIIKKSFDITNNKIGYDLTRIAYQYQLEHKIDSTDLNRPLYKVLSQIILEGQKNKEFNNIKSADYYTMLIVRNLRGVIYEWCMTQQSFDIEEHGCEYMEYLIKILL